MYLSILVKFDAHSILLNAVLRGCLSYNCRGTDFVKITCMYVTIDYIAWIRQSQTQIIQLISSYSTIIVNHREIMIVILNY